MGARALLLLAVLGSAPAVVAGPQGPRAAEPARLAAARCSTPSPPPAPAWWRSAITASSCCPTTAAAAGHRPPGTHPGTAHRRVFLRSTARHRRGPRPRRPDELGCGAYLAAHPPRARGAAPAAGCLVRRQPPRHRDRCLQHLPDEHGRGRELAGRHIRAGAANRGGHCARPGTPQRLRSGRRWRRVPPQPHRGRERGAALHRRGSRSPLPLGRRGRELAAARLALRGLLLRRTAPGHGRGARVRLARQPLSLGQRGRELAQARHRARSRCSMAARASARRSVVLVGLSGVVLISRDGGRSFTLLQQADHSGLAAAIGVGPGALAAVGEAGARVIELSAAPQAAGRAP